MFIVKSNYVIKGDTLVFSIEACVKGGSQFGHIRDRCCQAKTPDILESFKYILKGVDEDRKMWEEFKDREFNCHFQGDGILDARFKIGDIWHVEEAGVYVWFFRVGEVEGEIDRSIVDFPFGDLEKKLVEWTVPPARFCECGCREHYKKYQYACLSRIDSLFRRFQEHPSVAGIEVRTLGGRFSLILNGLPATAASMDVWLHYWPGKELSWVDEGMLLGDDRAWFELHHGPAHGTRKSVRFCGMAVWADKGWDPDLLPNLGFEYLGPSVARWGQITG